MIARLKGILLEKSPSRIVVDVGGVGYDVMVPLSTLYGLGEAGEVVALRVHTHVREDVIALFGFTTALEQDLFERLIAISGIGPQVALAVLSGIEPTERARAIERADLARLTAIPGVGKKTAERICLELRDKLVLTEAQKAAAPMPSRTTIDDDVQSALVNLGYRPAAAESAVDGARKQLGSDAEFSALLKAALRQLTK